MNSIKVRIVGPEDRVRAIAVEIEGDFEAGAVRVGDVRPHREDDLLEPAPLRHIELSEIVIELFVQTIAGTIAGVAAPPLSRVLQDKIEHLSTLLQKKIEEWRQDKSLRVEVSEESEKPSEQEDRNETKGRKETGTDSGREPQ